MQANPKVHIIDCGLIEVFSNLVVGKHIESIVARHLDFSQQSYFRNRGEVDFVVRQGERILPIEVKYREHVRKQDLAGLRALRTKVPFDRAIVVTKSYKGEQDGIVFVPAHLFLALV